MSRKRLTLEIEEEMETNEKLFTKKELAKKGGQPSCPVPLKVRKNLKFKQNKKKLAPLCFNNTAHLSPVYNANLNTSYFDQVFKTLGCIGEGSFGKVYKVISKEDGQLYAVKKIKAHISFKDRCAEVKNNEMLGSHANCVQYFMAWEESIYSYMQLEYCDMSLADYAKLNNEIPEALMWLVLHDICKALNFIHKKQFLHLDVKPGNIMITKGIFKLGDFGLLVNLQSGDQVKKSTLSEGDSKYLAVEILEGIYTTACDIFGLGLTILELATDIALPDQGVVWRQLRSGILPPWLYDRVSSGLALLVEKMVSEDYKSRPTTEKILTHQQLETITKQDKIAPRFDFTASFIKEDLNHNMPLTPIHLNSSNTSNTVTPPFNNSQHLYVADSSPNQVSDEDSPSPLNCKKNLFCKENLFCDIKTSSPSDLFLMDSGIVCDASTTSISNATVRDISYDSFNAASVVVSTPVNDTKQVRRIPKIKLSFV